MLQKFKKKIEEKEKKSRKVKMQDLFIQSAEKIEISFNNMNNAIYALCDGKTKEIKKYCEATVIAEKEADRIFEEISARLFSREVMVFSRGDRLYIAKHIEEVIDAAETVARRLLIHKPKVFPDLSEMLKDVATKAKNIGQILKKVIVKIFDDFDEAERLVNQIQDIRRDAREVEYQFLEKLYEFKPEYADFIFYDQIIKKILLAINKAENFGDGIRGLIWKYRF